MQAGQAAAAPAETDGREWPDADMAYLEQRAEAELALAQASTHPAAVRAHYHLAAHYLDRLYGPANDRDAGGS